MREKQTICVAGKNNIACDTLKYLIENFGDYYNFIACCNQTENGISGWQNSYRAYINSIGVKELRLEELYGIKDLIFISTEFDRIIKPLQFQNASLYNIHFSLLPAYRGMYTSALPILHGEKQSGVTLHEIDEGIDTGKIIAQVSFDLDDKMTSRDLYLRYIAEGTALLKRNLVNLLSGNYQAYEQPIQGASYFSKKEIDYSNLRVNLNCTAYQVQNQLRAYSFEEYQLPKICDKEIVSWRILYQRSSKKPGTIVWMDNEQAVVSTIDYDILVNLMPE